MKLVSAFLNKWANLTRFLNYYRDGEGNINLFYKKL